MPKRSTEDLSGQSFGEYIVIKHAYRKADGRGFRSYWLCVCSCGELVCVRQPDLKSGRNSKCFSCAAKQKCVTHGYKSLASKSRKTYGAWVALRERCRNPNNPKFKYYGGRGITFVERWDSFENFVADMGHAPPKHSLDRIDVNGNYEPSNCRWVTQQTQVRNRTNTVKVTYKGKEVPLAHVAETEQVDYQRLYWQVYKGRTIEEGLKRLKD